MHAVQTTEDAENLEIAKGMRAGDQKQKYNLEWLYLQGKLVITYLKEL